MSAAGGVLDPALRRGYRHEALVYAGVAEFLQSALEFIDAGLRADEAVLVVVDEDKIDALAHDLGDDADLVCFADMADVGSNPARIIAAWHDFIAEQSGLGPMRGIGEPVHGARGADELAECQRHEALLNLAFADVESFTLLCPYDQDSLADDVLTEAFRTHPWIASSTAERRSSALFEPPDAATVFGGHLPPAPEQATTVSFGTADLSRLRRLVVEQATEQRFHPAQIGEVETAVNEVATNAIEHGGGERVARIWADDDALVFEVTDGGRFDNLLAGRFPPSPGRVDGRGLWIANQLCDLVQIRSDASGTVVRGRVRRIGSA